jgi:hypothetical protein
MSIKWEHDPSFYHGCSLTGYTGLDTDAVYECKTMPARRSQIGPRGFYKGGLAVLPNGRLLASPVSILEPRQPVPYPPSRSDLLTESWPVHLYESLDCGETWHPVDHTPLLGKENALISVDDGTLLFTSESLCGVACSVDGGRTWDVRPFELPIEDNRQHASAVRNIIRQADGSISILQCIGTMEGSENDGPPPPCCRAWLIHSRDRGRTWPEREGIEAWDDWFHMFAEADYLNLPDGRVLALSRMEYLHPISGTQPPFPPGSQDNDHSAGHMVIFESADGGRHWSGPRDFLNYSEVQGQLTLLADGRILCTYTNYHLPFGVGAVVSSDSGLTWDMNNRYVLAVSNATSTGWATTRQLPDGDLITTYALEPYHLEPAESGKTVFQCVRWNL